MHYKNNDLLSLESEQQNFRHSNQNMVDSCIKHNYFQKLAITGNIEMINTQTFQAS